jgi:hypothetical protein
VAAVVASPEITGWPGATVGSACAEPDDLGEGSLHQRGGEAIGEEAGVTVGGLDQLLGALAEERAKGGAEMTEAKM